VILLDLSIEKSKGRSKSKKKEKKEIESLKIKISLPQNIPGNAEHKQKTITAEMNDILKV
jgi:hypothetical protein